MLLQRRRWRLRAVPNRQGVGVAVQSVGATTPARTRAQQPLDDHTLARLQAVLDDDHAAVLRSELQVAPDSTLLPSPTDEDERALLVDRHRGERNDEHLLGVAEVEP